MNLNRPTQMVDPSHFAMVPRSDVPRSRFQTKATVKSTFDVGYLIPFHIREVIPGDVHKAACTIFARVNNLIFPMMDNMQCETFFFFVPCRLLWSHWPNFMGEQDNPGDTIAYTIPQCPSPAGGFAISTLADYFGLPTVGQVTAGQVVNVNTLPLRAYNLIYNEWFRDEDLINSRIFNLGDGPDSITSFTLQRRAKRHDYFTSCRPWPLKGGVESVLPLGGTAVVKTAASPNVSGTNLNALTFIRSDTGGALNANVAIRFAGGGLEPSTTAAATGSGQFAVPNNLYADLATATGPTINAMRLAITTQQFLEKDARGGTRYTEVLRNHFGVNPEDARMQRPEYIGGGRSDIHTSAIPQTSATGLTGGSSPQGSLAAQAIVADRHHYSYYAKEHGYIIGIVNVTADVTYQQGLHRLWTRQTRFDFPWPTFAHLGEQAVRNDEIYCQGGAADAQTFGYNERYAEFRYEPSRITGLFRSTSAGSIDPWHLAQKFTTLPVLNQTFVEDTPPMSRALAAGSAANGMQILFDALFDFDTTRPLPTYSVPGLTRF